MAKAFKFSLAILAIAIAALLTSPIVIYQTMLAPLEKESRKATVEIKPGMHTRQIGEMLEKNRILKSSTGFTLYVMYTGNSKALQAGEYELDPSKTVPEILEDIIKGKIVLRSVTIPEGLTIKETASIIEKEHFGTESSFISAASDPEILDKFDIRAKNAEGYLFPETYRFGKDATEREIVEAMISTFFKIVNPVREKYQNDSTLTFPEIITLASIIEKETGDKSEYRLVSAVYNNRLKKKMRLQADPTVIYGLPDFDGNITKKDLSYDSPYNTYVYAGLPPGPIANPGLGAIEAAYRPEDVKSLYFVATEAGGKHYFSNTYEEHKKAVRKYQLRRRKR